MTILWICLSPFSGRGFHTNFLCPKHSYSLLSGILYTEKAFFISFLVPLWLKKWKTFQTVRNEAFFWFVFFAEWPEKSITHTACSGCSPSSWQYSRPCWEVPLKKSHWHPRAYWLLWKSHCARGQKHLCIPFMKHFFTQYWGMLCALLLLGPMRRFTKWKQIRGSECYRQ